MIDDRSTEPITEKELEVDTMQERMQELYCC
jgi:hypothetical protein